MRTNSTIDRPSTHDPKKQDPVMTHSLGSAALHRYETAAPQNRNREMQLIPEALARAQMHDRIHEAESERRALRLAGARRMQRRAERASLRARRALALAVMQ